MQKILVSSIPAWSQKIGSDTMSSLVQGMDKDSLACIYVKADMSDSPACDRYFHIFEGRVVKSLLKRKMVTGEEYSLSEQIKGSGAEVKDDEADAEQARINKYRNRRPTSVLLGRELLWKLGNWKSKELDAFLDDFKPDVFFFSIEPYIYFNRLNEYIIKRCKPKKVIGYLWDDNFTYKQNPHGGPLSKFQRWWLRQGVKRLVKQCDTVFSICPKMKREVDEEFGIDSVLLTKPIAKTAEFKSYEPAKPLKMVYTGKLIIGRENTVAQIVDALKEINKEERKAVLHIYTQTALSDEMKERIDVAGCCELHGAVPQSEVASIQDSADVLLFAESLSGKKPTARLSFSTKLTDYFAAGKCIWGVGNKDLAPIEYLRECDAGLVSTNDDEIRDVLEKMVSDSNVVKEYARKGYDCGQERHNASIVHNTFRKVLG